MATPTKTISNGITWYYDSNVNQGLYVTGDPWVQASSLTIDAVGTIDKSYGINISAITPSCHMGAGSVRHPTPTSLWRTRWNDLNGSMVNPHPWNSNYRYDGAPDWNGAPQQDGNHWSFGFVGSATQGGANMRSAYTYLRETNWALSGAGSSWATSLTKSLWIGESLISCNSMQPGNTGYWTIPFGGSWGQIVKHGILTCVEGIPNSNDFRPAWALSGVNRIIGNSLKMDTLNTSNIDYTRLSDIDAATVSSFAPSADYYQMFVSALRGPNMTVISPSQGHVMCGTDDLMTNGYGQAVAGVQNVAIAYINTNLLNSADKQTIANYIIQRGIDFWGYLKQAQDFSSVGAVSALGFPFYGEGGGQANSMNGPLLFLYGMLKEGAKRKELRKLLDDIRQHSLQTKTVFPFDCQTFEVSAENLGRGVSPYLYSQNSAYMGISGELTYQASDLGRQEFRMTSDQPIWQGSDAERKGFSQEEAVSVMAGVPGYNFNDIYHFWQSYRQCCTTMMWVPLLFGLRAMGMDKVLNRYHPHLSRYTDTFVRRQRSGPDAHGGNGSYLYTGAALYVSGPTSVVSVSSINAEFATRLYEMYSHPSFQSGASGSIEYTMPVSGVESISLPTSATIYIDVSTPVESTTSITTKTFYCRGLGSAVAGDSLSLLIGFGDDYSEYNSSLIGANYILSSYVSQYAFTLQGDIATAQVQIPANSTGQKYVAQGLIFQGTNIDITNAIAFTIQ